MRLGIVTALAASLAVCAFPAGAAPAKVAFVGDSMSDGIWGAFFRLTGNNKCSDQITLIRDARNGTGLARPDHFDWNAELDSLITKEAPTLVFASIGLNDEQDLVVMPDKSKLHLGTDEWLTQYKKNVSDFYEHAGKGGAAVMIVGLPNLRDSSAEKHAELVNGIYQDVAKSETDVSVTYVEPWRLANDDGGFASFGPNVDGQTVQLRAPDGLHFTQAGYDVLARYLEPSLDKALAAAHVTLPATCLGG
jgi:hypothetical protein